MTRSERTRRHPFLRARIRFAPCAALVLLSPAVASAHPFRYVDRDGLEHELTTERLESNEPDPAADVDGKSLPLGKGSLPFDSIVREAGYVHRLPTALIHAVIRVESAYDPTAVSAAGAVGLMQLMPATISDLGVVNPFDPNENVMAGARYLRLLIDSFDGDMSRALAAYHAGPRRVRRAGGVAPTVTTRRYVWAVLREYRATSYQTPDKS